MTYGDSQWQDLLTAVDNHTITYDAIGNPLSYYDGSTMVWTEGRRLQTVTQNGQTYSYLYDADGLRIQKTNPDGTYIKYHLLNGRYLGETLYGTDNIPDRYIRYTYDEGDNICGISIWYEAQSRAWDIYYFERNLQGDVIAMYTATNGANGLPELVASYTYDAWGNVLTATGELAGINPFRYRGYYYDAETQFYYLQSRYYNPEIGRFINADDVAYLGASGTVNSYNLFAYCLNNPINMQDDLGNLPKWLKKVTQAVAVVAVVTVAAAAVVASVGAAAVTAGIVSATMVKAAVVGTAVGGAVAGGVNIPSQIVTKGAENIDLAEVAANTMVGCITGTLSGGSSSIVPAAKAGTTTLLSQQACQTAINVPVTNMAYLLTEPEPTATGFGISTLSGIASGILFNAPAKISTIVSVGFEFASYVEDFIKISD